MAPMLPRADVDDNSQSLEHPSGAVQSPDSEHDAPASGSIGISAIWCGWRFWPTCTRKSQRHQRILETPTRPNSTYSITRVAPDGTAETVNVQLHAESPLKGHRLLLFTTPMQQGRFAPSSKLFAIQEEQGSSPRSSSPYDSVSLPRAPSPVALGKSTLTFPKRGAPQETRHVRAAPSCGSSYNSTTLHEIVLGSGCSAGSSKLSATPSDYSLTLPEFEGLGHPFSSVQPGARY